MSVAWYIVLEKQIPGFDAFVSGKALAKSAEKLDSIAKQHSVRPLLGFFSLSQEEMSSFAASEGVELEKEIEETWFAAQEGLQTVDLLLEKLEQEALNDGVKNELVEFRRVLEIVKEHGVRWHLAVDF